ncbi:MAG: 1,4-beta-N-acetylmuramidase [Oscillospiraceae bacterium]|nr:1,4-beta-N-acetylmuramidase [Oscillospiraceae bacterium]
MTAFKKVKESGIEFVIVKAGYSTSTVPTWEINYANAKNNGLMVGAYWYSYATTIEQGVEEAKAFIAALKGKQLDFPVYLDLEERSQFNKGKGFCTQLVEAFCGELTKAGYYAGVYCSTYWYTNFVEEKVREKYPAWIADYRGECYYTGTYGIWQYGVGKVSGIVGDCDLDEGYVDYSVYIKENGLNGYPKEIEPPVGDKPGDELALEVIRGEWGSGQERYDRLTAAGYDYDAVQARVNEMLYQPRKTIDELATEVIRGEWGAGEERYRLLTEAGYDYYQVQRKVNEILYK